MILGILDYRLSIEINILGEIISSSGVTLQKKPMINLWVTKNNHNQNAVLNLIIIMGIVIITLVSIENRSKMSKKLRIQHPNTSTLPFDSIEGSGLNSSNLIVVEAQTCDLRKIFFYLCRHLKIGMCSLLLYRWHINDKYNYFTKNLHILLHNMP